MHFIFRPAPLPQVAVPVAATVPDAAGDVMYAQAQPPTGQ